jgi:zinc protease
MKTHILLLMLLLLGATLAAQVSSDLNSSLPVDPELIIGKLPNGLTYYIKVNRNPEKRAELRLAINIGAIQEDDDQQGLAHFTEHMAFNGTRHFAKSELVDYLNSIGMGYANGLNGGTGSDQTVYQLQVPTDNAEQFRKGFLILSDWADGVAMDSLEIEKERGVIIEEWRMGQGAYQRINDAQWKVIFAGSRYAERMPIGKLEVLQNFRLADIRRFYHDWYRPDVQAVVAVGDFDPKVVENLIKEYFGSIPARTNPRPVVLYEVPDHKETRVVITTDPEATDNDIQLYWKQPLALNETIGDYRNSLLTNFFTQMLNMRLQELSRKAEPPFTDAYNFKYNITATKSSYILAASTSDTGILTGYRTLLTEAERVRRYGFTESEFERTKQMLLRQSERMLTEKDKQDSDRLVWRYVSAFIRSNPVMSIEQNVALNRELYAGISLQDVNDLCSAMMPDSNMVIAVSAPAKQEVVLPTEQQLLDLLAQVRSEEIAPYIDQFSEDALLSQDLKPLKVVKEKKYKQAGIKQWKLKNGITVLLKPTDFKNDEILMRAYSPGGTSQYALEDVLEAREAANIIAEAGVNGFTSTVLQKKLSGKIVRLEPFIGSDSEGFTANCSKADLETLFQLVYLYSTQPRLDEDSFASWLAKEQAYLQNQALDPQSAFFDSLSGFWVDFNPRTRNLKLEDLPSLQRERILQIYAERFADFTDFTFVFVGSFEEKQLKAFCEKYLANLPARGRQEQYIDHGVRFTQGKKDLTVYKGLDEKSTVMLTIYTPAELHGKARHELRSLTMLLDEKLRENIREARSGVYFVGSWSSIGKYPSPYTQIDIYMQCAPERTTELTAAILATLDSLKAGQFDEKYVNVVKMTSQKRLETDLRENRWWLNAIYDQIYYGYALNDLLADRSDIAKLDMEQLRKTAAQYLNHDTNLVKGILLPAPKTAP